MSEPFANLAALLNQFLNCGGKETFSSEVNGNLGDVPFHMTVNWTRNFEKTPEAGDNKGFLFQNGDSLIIQNGDNLTIQ